MNSYANLWFADVTLTQYSHLSSSFTVILLDSVFYLYFIILFYSLSIKPLLYILTTSIRLYVSNTVVKQVMSLNRY
jgi:hypothetical protein